MGLSGFRGLEFRIPLRGLSGFRVSPGLVVPEYSLIEIVLSFICSEIQLQNRRFLSVTPIPNATVVASLRQPLHVTKYLSSARSYCCILLWLSI